MEITTKERLRIDAESKPNAPAKATPQKVNDFVNNIIDRRIKRDNNGTTEVLGDMWKKLNELVLKELEKLQTLQPAVEASFAQRVKTKESLLGKIAKRQEKGGFQTMAEIEAEQWDIAGIRIRLYFPHQLQMVNKFIKGIQNFEQVRDKEFREHGWVDRNQDTRPYLERMGYYLADHYWVKMKRTDQLLGLIPNYNDEVVEIQVRSALMDAWAEVRHDLDYKNMFGRASADELRVLDAIKANVASAEIMLDQLFILREKRIEANKQIFSYRDPRSFWDGILSSLQPRHGLLLEKLGSERPSDEYMEKKAPALLREFGIYTPNDLQSKFDCLIGTSQQNEAMRRAEESVVERPQGRYYDRYLCADANFELTLFEFIFLFLTTKLSINDLASTFSSPDRLDNDIDHARVWHCLLGTVLRRMWKWTQSSFSEQEKSIQRRLVSVTWHVFEHITAIYQTPQGYTRIMYIVRNLLLFHRREPDDNGGFTIWDQRALWIYAAVTREWLDTGVWENKASFVFRSQGDMEGVTTWTGLELTPADWESSSWDQGQLIAAEVIGIKPSQLRQTTVFRLLCQRQQYPILDKYILHCLSQDIDIYWQEPCGISILGAAAVFATPRVCEAILARRLPGICINPTFSDGLSVMHIAVLNFNPNMAKFLLANGGADLETPWHIDPIPGRAPQWGLWSDEPDRSMDWAYGWDVNNEYERHSSKFLTQFCDKFFWTALELAKNRLFEFESEISDFLHILRLSRWQVLRLHIRMDNGKPQGYHIQNPRLDVKRLLQLYELYHLLHAATYSTELGFLESATFWKSLTPTGHTSSTLALVEDKFFPTMEYTIGIPVASAFIVLIPDSPVPDGAGWAMQRLLNLSSSRVHITLPTQFFCHQWTAYIITFAQPPRILAKTIIEVAAAVEPSPVVDAKKMMFTVFVRPPMPAILLVHDKTHNYLTGAVVRAKTGTHLVEVPSNEEIYVGKLHARLLPLAAVSANGRINFNTTLNLSPMVEFDSPIGGVAFLQDTTTLEFIAGSKYPKFKYEVKEKVFRLSLAWGLANAEWFSPVLSRQLSDSIELNDDDPDRLRGPYWLRGFCNSKSTLKVAVVATTTRPFQKLSSVVYIRKLGKQWAEVAKPTDQLQPT